MLLDAQSFKTVLTPESALGIIQQMVNKKGWKQYDVSDVKLVYTPYWVFSFDVLVGESSPTGKTALNAYTGDLNDYVPYILERPSKKSNQTEEGAEVEVLPTAISRPELNDVGATKVAAHAGLKKDAVSISAATKYYIPSYQVWVDVAGDSFKIDIDAILGNPQGAEAIPERKKGWNEAADETVRKMKTPSGWMELIGKTFSMLLGAGKSAATGGGSEGKGLQSPLLRYVVLGLIVLGVAWFFFFRGSTQGSVDCSLNPGYYNAPEWFGLGAKTVKPSITTQGKLSVQGTCNFYNPGTEDIASMVAIVKLTSNDREVAQNTSFVGLLSPTGKTPTRKAFEIVWEGSPTQKYYFSYCRLEDCAR